MIDYPEIHREYTIRFEKNQFELIRSPFGMEEYPTTICYKRLYNELIIGVTHELADTLYLGSCNTFYNIELDLKQVMPLFSTTDFFYRTTC